MIKAPALVALLIGLLSPTLAAAEREIYFEDFETAPVGDDQLVGYDNWGGSPTNRGSHGIDAGAVEGLGQSAFIGFNSPGFTTSATVGRAVSHDPVATGERFVRLTAAIGINDSDNGQIPPRNLFFVDFANSNLTRLASLSYNNTEAGFGLWRDDGNNVHDSDEEFIRGEIQLLFVEIDMIANTWTVELDGFSIFQDEPFTTKTTVPLDLGAIFFSWQRGSQPWGNNWMLFDDISVTVDTTPTVIPADPFLIASVGRDSSNCALLTWKAQPGFTYQVEYSDDLVTWRTDLPDSTKTEPVEQDTSYVDLSSTNLPSRAYRVVRTETP